MITFTPLAGAAQGDRPWPLCYVLQIDDVNILLDCGSPDWNLEHRDASSGEAAWERYCLELQKIAPSIDLVLLSHGDLAHAGLFAYAFSRWGLKGAAYCTLPVQAMARVCIMEEVISFRLEQQVDPEPVERPMDENAMEEDQELSVSVKNGLRIATLDEVNDAFESVVTLRYSQPTHLTGKCQGITITPFAAGHTIGGTAWKIRSPSAGTILYAVNLNHLKERHLDGSVITLNPSGGFFEPLNRPDLLITDAERALTIGSRRKDRDKMLLDLITNTLASGHSLLLPTDSSTRLLELLVLTDQHWAYSRLKSPICLISKTTKEMLTTTRSLMEWLGGTISKEDVGDTGTKRNPRRRQGDDDEDALGPVALRFPFVEFFSTPGELLHRFPSKTPKLILAVPASLSHGPSRQIFSDFAAVPGNVVVLTGRSDPGTLSHFLMERWEALQEDTERWQDGKLGEPISIDRPIDIELRSKIPLQGEELAQFLAKQKAKKERETAEKAAAARLQQIAMDEDEEDENEESEGDTDTDTHPSDDEMDMGRDHRRGGLRRRMGDEVDWELREQDEAGFGVRQVVDIYVRPVVRTAPDGGDNPGSFFRTNPNAALIQAPKVKMFPFVERRRRIDDFGEVVDVNAWLRKGKIFDEKAEDEDLKELREKRKKETDKKEPEETPSKYIVESVNLDLRCKVYFVDLEGLHDGRALRNIVPHINPRRMIIVQATQAAAKSLVDSCTLVRSMTTDIYSPGIGETIRIGEHMHNFTIMLSDALMASVKMSSFEDSEIAFVKGKINIPHSGVPVLEPLLIASEKAEKRGRNKAPVAQQVSTNVAPIPRAMMIGDLKLTALKLKLNEIGIKTEFAGEGVLVCKAVVDGYEDVVAVRKTKRGEVKVEGGASEMFYTVRDAIYKLHALVETK